MFDRKFKLFIKTVFVCSLLSACGGGGSGSTGQAQGSTVAIQAAIKANTNMSVFTGYTSASNANSWGPSLSFTLKSVSNSNAGAMASDVKFTSQIISYEYVPSGAIPAGAGAALVIPPIIYNDTIIVPANGTFDYNNVPMFSPVQKQYLKAQSPLANNTQQLTYRMRITFNGSEVKNGSDLTVSTTADSVIVQ